MSSFTNAYTGPKFTVPFAKIKTPEPPPGGWPAFDLKAILTENSIKDTDSFITFKPEPKKYQKKIIEPEVEAVWADVKMVLDVSQPGSRPLMLKELIDGKFFEDKPELIESIQSDIVTHFEDKIAQDIFKMINPIANFNDKFFDPSMPNIAKIYTDSKYKSLVEHEMSQAKSIAESIQQDRKAKEVVIAEALGAAEKEFLKKYCNVNLKPDIFQEDQMSQLKRFVQYKKDHPEDTALAYFPKNNTPVENAKTAALKAFRETVHANQYDCTVSEAKLMARLDAMESAFDPSKLGIQHPARGMVIDIPDEAYDDDDL